MPIAVVNLEGARQAQAQMGRVVRGEVRVDPASYRGRSLDSAHTAYQINGDNPDNKRHMAYAIDLAQFERGWPTVAPGDRLLAFGLDHAKIRQLGENEAFSWEYGDAAFQALEVQWCVAGALARRDPRWQPVADGMRDYLRALIGWWVLGSCWGEGRDKSAGLGVGAKVVLCAGTKIKAFCGAPYCVAIGKRSWIFDRTWAGPIHYAPLALSTYAWGESRKCRGGLFPDSVREACRGRGWPVELFSPEEQATMKRARANDVEALLWVLANLVRDYIPNEPIHLLRTKHGVSWTVLLAGGAPTATGYHCTWLDDGTVWFAGADPGGRGKGAIQPGRAEVNVAERTGFCVRTAGEPRPVVNFELAPGEIVFELLSRGFGQKPEVLQPKGAGAPPKPPPTKFFPPVAAGGGGGGGGCAFVADGSDISVWTLVFVVSFLSATALFDYIRLRLYRRKHYRPSASD